MTVPILDDNTVPQWGKVSGRKMSGESGESDGGRGSVKKKYTAISTYEWQVCWSQMESWLSEGREKVHCGPVIIVNVPGMWGKWTLLTVMATFPASLVTGTVSWSFLKRELCCAELSTILTASLTMADNRADVQATHICSGLILLLTPLPCSPFINTYTWAPIRQTMSCFMQASN